MTVAVERSTLIGAPLELVWDFTQDLDKSPRYFIHLKEVTLLERTPGRLVFRMATADESWTSERLVDPTARVSISRRLDPIAAGFDNWEMRWSYRAVDGGTLMTFRQEFAIHHPNAWFARVREWMLVPVSHIFIARVLARMKRNIEAEFTTETARGAA